MLVQGVLVEVHHPKFGLSKGSGFLINNTVIVHGSLLLPLCCFDSDSKNLLKNFDEIFTELSRAYNFDDPESQAKCNSFKFKILTTPSHNHNEPESCHGHSRINSVDGKLCFLYKYNKLTSITDEISNWTYNAKKDTSDNHRLGCLIIPIFLFLMIGLPSESSLKRTLHLMYNEVKDTLIFPGQQIIVESTPFANNSFLNSVSRGIISKVMGRNQDGLLTDARLVFGCEGAPIFVSQDGKKGTLAGIVILAISWSDGEWVGFSLGLSIRHLLKAVLELKSHDYIPFNRSQLDPKNYFLDIDRLRASVLLVLCQHKWGSGVVVDSDTGLVLTCSHMVDHAPNLVQVVIEGKKYPATVIYSSPRSKPYDLALLSVGPICGLKQLEMAKNPPIMGEPVITAGYPLLPKSSLTSTDGPTPTLCAGYVAHMSCPGGPLQTTCCTQSGVSGGALIRYPNQLLGIVVSNTCIDSAILPFFGFAVSVDDFKNHVLQYISSKDPACLQSLTVESNEIKMKWSFKNCKL